MQGRTSHHIKGIDVSHWQGEIEWKKVKDAGTAFVFIKATEAQTFIDPMFRHYYEGAAEVGLAIGFYHFARFSNKKEAVKEAKHFIQTTKGLGVNLPYVLDLESTNATAAGDLSMAAATYLDTIESETDHDTMLYTYTNFAKNHLTQRLKEIPLWIAHYGVKQPGRNGIWEKWSAFQYSDKGQIDGINGYVDVDVIEQGMISTGKKTIVARDKSGHQYKIRQGDTFWALENQWHLPHGTLQQLNPKADPKLLKIGQLIDKSPSVNSYVIRKGDTFWELERHHHWKDGTLSRLNPDKDPQKLQIGERIKTP